jgi:hypothetical protein
VQTGCQVGVVEGIGLALSTSTVLSTGVVEVVRRVEVRGAGVVGNKEQAERVRVRTKMMARMETVG